MSPVSPFNELSNLRVILETPCYGPNVFIHPPPPPANPYVKILTPDVMAFGGRAFGD